jgi:hypothetical protein
MSIIMIIIMEFVLTLDRSHMMATTIMDSIPVGGTFVFLSDVSTSTVSHRLDLDRHSLKAVHDKIDQPRSTVPIFNIMTMEDHVESSTFVNSNNSINNNDDNDNDDNNDINGSNNNNNSNMLPSSVTDFVFDLFETVTASHIAEEQYKLYYTEFPELTKKYFASSDNTWPEPMSIAAECNGHPLSLALYREMTYRHWHSIISRPNIRDRIEGWSVYRELFEEILESAEDSTFYLVPGWTWDIFNEFVYQFQGFCQFRTAAYTAARKQGYVHDARLATNNHSFSLWCACGIFFPITLGQLLTHCCLHFFDPYSLFFFPFSILQSHFT